MKFSTMTGFFSYFGFSAGSGEIVQSSTVSNSNPSTSMASCVLKRYPKRTRSSDFSQNTVGWPAKKDDARPTRNSSVGCRGDFTKIRTDVRGEDNGTKSKEEQGGAFCDFSGHPTSQTYTFLDCKKQLMRDFDRIYAHDILKLMEFHKGSYSATYQSLSYVRDTFEEKEHQYVRGKRQMKAAMATVTLENDKGTSQTFNIHRMAGVRHVERRYVVPLLLRPEVDFIQTLYKEKSTEPTYYDETLEAGQGIECVCCYGECAFETMAQCLDGHLVCVECLNSFSKEAAFGNGKVELKCMAPECSTPYPRSELKRCVASKTWHKLEERAREENLNMAGLEDLVRCPHCDFAALLSSEIQMFVCQNDDCQVAICRVCRNKWIGSHEFCPALEKPDETALRVQKEEELTMSTIRTCVTCKAQFFKGSGCNKMTCRCGATMCYVCKTPNIDYSHFCAHPRDPGKPCKECNACSLWKK